MFISSFFKISSSLVFSVFKTFPRSGNIAWYLLSLPCFAEPPSESPSTKYNSFLVLSLDWAVVNFPDKALSLGVFFLPFRASSRAFLAASLAILLRRDLLIISVAIALFSSKNTFNCSVTIASTAVLAAGVPYFPLVWPSNCKRDSGIFREMTAVSPSLTSPPSRALSFDFIKLLLLA